MFNQIFFETKSSDIKVVLTRISTLVSLWLTAIPFCETNEKQQMKDCYDSMIVGIFLLAHLKIFFRFR